MLQQSYALLDVTYRQSGGEWGLDAAREFEEARSKAFWNRIISTITFRNNRLPTPADVLAGRPVVNTVDLGRQTVPIDRIVGSTERARATDFDRHFLPAQSHTRERWMSVNRAYQRGVTLPALELHQIGEEYFVADGHHRVSVARSHGQRYIDAHVIGLRVAGSEAITSEQ